MRFSQVLVIAAVSLLFANDTVAVATSNHAAISKTVQSSQSQRLLRSNKYLVDEEEDQSEDSVDFEERGGGKSHPLNESQVKKLEAIARSWGTTYTRVAMGQSGIATEKINALLAMRDAYMLRDRVAKQAAKMMVLRASQS
ncbi:hypothetical protein DVH05_003510 [Phytophthora capsici]|nr:hypothetical protein DVH05_003510 [Phytophthora capsici]